MNLQPSDDEPGLWVNEDWQPETPGTFAVIIGVSDYPYLDGGAHAVQDTFDLGQLRVSALTAHEVFSWLRDSYRVDNCPLAKCWLLLAPTQEEIDYRGELADHPSKPTLANCDLALRFWLQTMADLPAQAAAESQAFFFFSGHGLETHQEQQILLPHDYLKPPMPSLDAAISTSNLKRGLAGCTVPHQLFFLDACRNDNLRLRSQVLEGASILNEPEAARVNQDVVAPLLYATAAGTKAYQQPTPEHGLSLFGQALLDGLRGQPHIDLDCRNGECAVKLYPLEEFVRERVTELIRESGERVRQTVKFGGSSIRNLPITFIDRGGLPARPAEPELQPPTRGGAEAGILEDRAMSSPATRRIEGRLESVFSVTHEIEPPRPPSDLAGGSDGHAVLGSESVTAIFGGQFSVYSLGRRIWQDPKSIRLHRLDRDDETSEYRIIVSFDEHDEVGHWLQVIGPGGIPFGCTLPNDRSGHPRFQIEFGFEFDDNDHRHLTQFEAYLAFDNPQPLAMAAEVWQRYRTASLGDAVTAVEMSELEDMVRSKNVSPVAAIVASLILLRANRLDLLHDWVRNIANWFEERTDGPVLWAEQLTRQVSGGGASDAVDFLTDLLERGLPHTSEGMGYAASLLNRLSLDAEATDRLAPLKQQLDGALPYFRPGGLFASYAGFPLDRDPIDWLVPRE